MTETNTGEGKGGGRAAKGGRRKRSGKMDIAELEAHVSRLELEVRELEAREKMHELKSRVADDRASGARGKKRQKTETA